MTIRRRLFWSNILMIAIPVALCALVSYFILFVFTRSSDIPMEKAFPQAVGAVSSFYRSGDLEQLKESVDQFNQSFSETGVYIAVMEGDAFLYPDDAGELVAQSGPLMWALINDGATGSVSVNNLKVNIEQVGNYRILMVDTQAPGRYASLRPPMRYINLIIVSVIIAILIANRVVTHLLTRRIMRPLNKLAEGAHQLGEGNLDYRIHYELRDEFTPVCADFNEMADQLRQLIQLQRKNEESRKELLAGISHDLRTPLTSIKAYVEGLLDGVAEDLPSQLKYLSIIRNKAEDIDRIVDKLFLFSKLDIGEYPANPEPLNLGEELLTMAGAVGEEYGEKGLSMELEGLPEDIWIYMDQVYLHNVLVNILENSLKYREKDRCTVTVECFAQELSATVWLTDDGPGVPEEDLEKIFEVFYRGDPSRQNPNRGSGLGLAISARMMERIGGSIRAENAQGGGLRMILQFPRYRAEKGGEREEGEG